MVFCILCVFRACEIPDAGTAEEHLELAASLALTNQLLDAGVMSPVVFHTLLVYR